MGRIHARAREAMESDDRVREHEHRVASLMRIGMDTHHRSHPRAQPCIRQHVDGP